MGRDHRATPNSLRYRPASERDFGKAIRRKIGAVGLPWKPMSSIYRLKFHPSAAKLIRTTYPPRHRRGGLRLYAQIFRVRKTDAILAIEKFQADPLALESLALKTTHSAYTFPSIQPARGDGMRFLIPERFLFPNLYDRLDTIIHTQRLIMIDTSKILASATKASTESASLRALLKSSHEALLKAIQDLKDAIAAGDPAAQAQAQKDIDDAVALLDADDQETADALAANVPPAA